MYSPKEDFRADAKRRVPLGGTPMQFHIYSTVFFSQAFATLERPCSIVHGEDWYKASQLAMAEGVGAAPTCPILETGAFAAMLPLNMLVGETGFEPARSQDQGILNPWWLPITPLPHKTRPKTRIFTEDTASTDVL